MSAPNMSETPYRTNAEIAEEIEPMPAVKEPWSSRKKGVVASLATVVAFDIGMTMIHWGAIGVREIGRGLAIHAGVAGLILVCSVPFWASGDS